ncbi:MAG: RNA polymerase factor sigma-54 [Veillonellales bacterium]
MDCGLKLEMQQKLVMTPQLRQAIAILQLSSLELAAMVEEEMRENPLLDIEERQPELSEEQPTEDSSNDANDYGEFTDYLAGGGTDYSIRRNEDKATFETFAASTITLHEHLELQLDLATADGKIKAVGRYLIGCIDDNGYLCGTVDEIKKITGASSTVVENALAMIQKFDPEGVGARNLKECLTIQLQQREIDSKLVQSIVSDHLPDLAKGSLKGIAAALQCSLREVQQAVDIIKRLNPKPGQAFGRGRLDYILPDVSIERREDDYVISVNDQMVPRLTISSSYRNLAREGNPEARKYVEGRLQAALWVVKSIEQRRRTLYNVTQAIVDLQRSFFDYGPKYLRPLVMKTVADRLGIHESTVSRATANKYAATPYGLVSLRSFFSAGVSGTAGEDIAASNVKQEIKQLITGEDATAPLSDQHISNILQERGIGICRRTVTKYREELGIAASSRRKRY